MAAENENQLVTLAVQGDRPALERLLLAHYDDLARCVQAKLPDAMRRVADVEDILQQAFVLAFRNIRSFEARGEGAFGAWLRTIAENASRDATKAELRQKRGGGKVVSSMPVAAGESSLIDLVEMLAHDSHTPSQSVAQREALQALNVAIAELPTDQRQAVRLRFLEGKNLEETAAAMGRTQDAIRGLVHRAKQTLREAMGRSSRWWPSK